MWYTARLFTLACGRKKEVLKKTEGGNLTDQDSLSVWIHLSDMDHNLMIQDAWWVKLKLNSLLHGMWIRFYIFTYH